MYKLIVLLWKREELSQELKESIIAAIHKKGDKMDCNNYSGISILSTSYKNLSNLVLSRTTSYANEIIGEYQRGFKKNRSTIDYIFSILQILEKKCGYNNEVCQSFIDFQKIILARLFWCTKTLD